MLASDSALEPPRQSDDQSPSSGGNADPGMGRRSRYS